MVLSELGEGDTIHARRPDGSGNLSLKVDEVKKEKLDGFYPKSKLKVLANNKRRDNSKTLDVVVKEAPVHSGDTETFGKERVGMTYAKRYYYRWLFLKSIGIPVVSSLRVVGKKHLLMGDMTADGSGFIDIHSLAKFKAGTLEPGYQLNEAERLFLKIDREDIKKEVTKIFQTAWRHDVRLSTDEEEFSVLVHPDGSWEVLVVDIGEMHKLRAVVNNDHHLKACCRDLEKRVDDLFSLIGSANGSVDKT